MLCREPALLELHGADIAQGRMQPRVIVETNPVHDGLSRLLPRGELASVDAGRFEVSHRLSVGALSQQSPLRLMELRMPQAFIVAWNS